MFLVFNLMFMLSKIDLTNSLYNCAMLKRATINGVVHNVLTDGETSRAYSFSFDGENITIKIPTDDTHLSHMVIYVGDGGPHWRDEDRNHTMDYVSISCDNHGGSDYYSKVCGEPSSPINRLKDITRGIRINLRYLQVYAVNLQFPGNVVKQINLAEIEIYAYETSYVDRARFLGCFKTLTNFRKTYNHFDLDKCIDDCQHFDPIAISKARKQCSCGFLLPYDQEINISDCNEICGGNRSCGAKKAFSVYITAYNMPYFMGCFKTHLVRPPSISIENITISKCLFECQDFFSVGLGRGKCVCLDYQFVEHVPDRWLCNQPCSEEASMCGGEEGVAVYRSCRHYFAKIDCFDLMKCKDDIFDHFGICTHGCKEGFAGEHCIERRTSTEHPSCISQCNQIFPQTSFQSPRQTETTAESDIHTDTTRAFEPSSVATEATTEPAVHNDTTKVATGETTQPVIHTNTTKVATGETTQPVIYTNTTKVATEETTQPVIYTNTTKVATEETTQPVIYTNTTKDHDDNESKGKSLVLEANYIISTSILTSILIS